MDLMCTSQSSWFSFTNFTRDRTPGVRKLSMIIFSTILLGYQAKMVRIGIIVALSDTHFCILSRDCFNLSREYFSLWVIENVTG